MNYQGSILGHRGNWRRHKNGRRPVPSDIRPSNLRAVSRRLRHVQIENRDALQLIREFDSPDTLFYLDPPYMFSTRTTKKAYAHEMTDKMHQEFAATLYDLKGLVVVSGYPSKEYEELFDKRGWKRYDKNAIVMGGGSRTECLWLSPATEAARNATEFALAASS